MMKLGKFGTYIIEMYDVQYIIKQTFSSTVIRKCTAILEISHDKLNKRYLFTALIQETDTHNSQLKNLQRFRKTFALY